MRKITLKELTAIDFKNHKALGVVFGTMNTIRGMNGEGKSSIGEIITWVLSSVDMLGSKLDPTPIDRKVDKVFGSILLEVDDKPLKFSRELVNGKATVYINDIPKKATEFNELVYSLTGTDSIDLFLSLFNPSYFPLMHWQDQRNMLFSYVSAPPQSDVLKKLPKLQSDKLKESFKKNNIADLEAFHKKNKTNKEKELIAAKSRVETLEGQLQGVEVDNLEELEQQAKQAVIDFNKAELEIAEIRKVETQYASKLRESAHLLTSIEGIKSNHAETKAETNCRTCAEPLSEDKKKELLTALNVAYKETVQLYKVAIAEAEAIVIPKTTYDYQAINENRIRLTMAANAEKNRLKAVETIEEANKAHKDVQDSLNESIFLLDAIKAFNAEEAKQQAEKVKALFTGIQLVLEDHLGKPWFSIAMNGKNYNKLSLGEKARAGLEVIAVLTQQSEVLAPTFIDNAESITSTFLVEHQSISAYAVPNQKLIVESEITKNDSIIVDCEVV